MIYLDMRHLIIHNQSKIDTIYYEKYKDIINIKKNTQISTDYTTIKNAINHVLIYVEKIDKSLIKEGFIKSR